MLYEDVYSLGDPGTFDITDKDNPLYYIARLCHEQSENLYNLNAEGFQYQQLEGSDIETQYTALNTYFNTIQAWFVTAVAASEAGTTIPAPANRPNLANLPVSGQIVAETILFAINLLLRWLWKKLDSDTDSTEIAQVLKRALLDTDGEGDEYAIIKQMANTPIEIVVSKADGYEDISYADRPET